MHWSKVVCCKVDETCQLTNLPHDMQRQTFRFPFLPVSLVTHHLPIKSVSWCLTRPGQIIIWTLFTFVFHFTVWHIYARGSLISKNKHVLSEMNSGVFEGASVGGGGRLQQFHTRKAASWSRPNSRRVDCVLAPIEAPSRASVSLTPSTSEPTTGTKNRLQDGVHRTVSTGKALVGQLWGIWQRDGAAPSAQTRQRGRDLQRLGEATTERGLQVRVILVRVKNSHLLGQQT